jgi:hypothetical protein
MLSQDFFAGFQCWSLCREPAALERTAKASERAAPRNVVHFANFCFSPPGIARDRAAHETPRKHWLSFQDEESKVMSTSD